MKKIKLKSAFDPGRRMAVFGKLFNFLFECCLYLSSFLPLFSSLWSTLSHAISCFLPSDFTLNDFSGCSPPTPSISKHVPQCLAWSSHFSQSLPSAKTCLAGWQALWNFISSFSCYWHILFLAYKCQQVRSRGKKHERLISQYQDQL